MSLKNKSVAALLGLIGLPAAASAGVVGGTYYDVRYDYSEFFAATDGRMVCARVRVGARRRL